MMAQVSYRNLLYGVETTSFQHGFQVGKHEKSLLGLSLENGVDGEKERRISQRTVVQYPSLVFQQLRPLHAHGISQTR